MFFFEVEICQYFHVKGTKRAPPRFQHQRDTEQNRNIPLNNDSVPSNVGNHSVQNSQNHFLFLLQQMKTDNSYHPQETGR